MNWYPRLVFVVALVNAVACAGAWATNGFGPMVLQNGLIAVAFFYASWVWRDRSKPRRQWFAWLGRLHNWVVELGLPKDQRGKKWPRADGRVMPLRDHT